MTSFSDGVNIGNIAALAEWNGQSAAIRGFPTNVIVYNITPVTLDPDGISVSASPGAGAIVIGGALATGGVATMDVPRSLAFVSGGNDSGITFTATGTDGYGDPQIETVTGANAGTAVSLKAFKTVTSVVQSAAVATTLTVGSGDKFGLPARVLVAPQIAFVKWSTAFAADAGTLAIAVTTDPATAITGDPRGTYLPSSASNSSRQLVVGIYLPTPADATSVHGVASFG